MVQYNLIRNGSLQALTSSGTGDIALSFSQLEKLQDQNLTSSGVSVAISGTLYLEADLSQRIKVDGIRLYADDLTKSSNIEFAFKNSSGASYTPLSTSVSSYYSTTIADPSAPRFVRAVISGTSMGLFEFQIFNDDTIVAFGDDGQLFAEYLQSTPIGTVGTPQAISIFNNGTSTIPAVAYTSIDYTATSGDNYVEISTSINGTYFSIDDGALIEDDKDNSTYKWSMGSFSNTEVNADKVIVTAPTVGTYTTPIFELTDNNQASYFVIDGNTTAVSDSISFDENVFNGTIRVRSSNTKPIDIEEVYWVYDDNAIDDIVLEKAVIYTGDVTATWVFFDANTRYNPIGTAVNRRNGNVAMVFKYDFGITFGSFVYIFNHAASLIHTRGSTSDTKSRFDVNTEFDKFGGIWGYGAEYGYLMHYDNDLSTVLYELYSSGTDFVYDLAVEMDGNGVWYTDKVDDILYHLDSDGTILHTIPLDTPRAICGTLDNGCWVIDNGVDIARRYNSSGVLVSSVSTGRDADRATTDMNNGFWYLSGNYLYHVTSGGVEDVTALEFDQPTKIKGGHNGVIVWSSAQNYVKYIDNDGNVTRTFSVPYSNDGYPALFSFRLDDAKDFQDTNNIMPVSYDPVWGTGGSLGWTEVRKDGYFLPKHTYQQAEITVRGSAELTKVIMAPALKVQDIPAGDFKNIYIRTNIPEVAGVDDYTARIKAWWGVS